MSDPSTMKPADQTNYLLGGLNAKMDAVISAQSGYDSRLRVVEAFMSSTPRRAPWPMVVTGIAGIGAIAMSSIALLNVLTGP